MRLLLLALGLGLPISSAQMCTRVTRDGQQCAPRWTFEGATYEGCTANNSATAGVEWCVTSIHADWHEGWGECVPGCVETAPPSCPRIAQSGAACLARWEYRNVVYTGCTTRLGRAEWCVTDAQPPPQPTDAASAGGAGTAAELVWEYCRPLSAACRRGDLRPGDDPSTVVASPPPPPPVRRDTRSTLDRCQRVTTGGQRCYDSWRYKGAPEKQCTTTGSSSGREWCATDNRQHWDWCREGCVTFGTDCPRVSTIGAHCLRTWQYQNAIFTGCTSEYATYEWCVIDNDINKPWEKRWARCQPGCVDALPPAPPPRPPPPPYAPDSFGGGGATHGAGAHGGDEAGGGPSSILLLAAALALVAGCAIAACLCRARASKRPGGADARRPHTRLVDGDDGDGGVARPANGAGVSRAGSVEAGARAAAGSSRALADGAPPPAYGSQVDAARPQRPGLKSGPAAARDPAAERVDVSLDLRPPTMCSPAFSEHRSAASFESADDGKLADGDLEPRSGAFAVAHAASSEARAGAPVVMI